MHEVGENAYIGVRMTDEGILLSHIMLQISMSYRSHGLVHRVSPTLSLYFRKTLVQVPQCLGEEGRKFAKRCDAATSSLDGEEYSEGSNPGALPSFVYGSVASRMGTTQRSSSNGDLLMSGGTMVSKMQS